MVLWLLEKLFMLLEELVSDRMKLVLQSYTTIQDPILLKLPSYFLDLYIFVHISSSGLLLVN
jgi:hypothetical protein